MKEYALNVYSKDGSTIRTELRKYQYNGTFMGERNVTTSISSPTKIAWEIGDYITLRGEKFYLRYVPAAKKQARRGTYGEAYVYDGIVFSGCMGLLMDIQFLDYIYDDNLIHYTGLSNFSFYVSNNDLTEFANRIRANIERVYGTGKWNIIIADEGVNVYDGETMIVEGSAIEFDDKSLSVSTGTSLYNGLCLVNTELDLNFFIRTIDGINTIIIGGSYCAIDTPVGYGKGRGLKTIQQSHTDNESIITRLHAYGSTRNLPYRYYNKKYNNIAKYPAMFDEDGTYLLDSRYINKLMLPYSEWVLNSNIWDAYIDSDRIDEIGIREGEVTFDGSDEDWDEVYPTLEEQTVDDWVAGMAVYESGYGINAGTYRTRLYTMVYEALCEVMDTATASTYAQEYTEMMIQFDPLQGRRSTEYGDAWLASRDWVRKVRETYLAFEFSAVSFLDELFENKDKWTDVDTTRYTHDVTDAEISTIKSYTYNSEGRLDKVTSSSNVADNGVSEDGTYDDGSADTAGNVINTWFELTIPQIGFDIEDWVDASENSAKLCMKSGMCAGMEFEIASCIAIDTSNYSKGWKLTLGRYQNSDINMVYPNTSYQIAAGDEYVITGIDMPDIYVEAAEQKLLKQAIEYLEDIDHTKYTYSLEVDSKWMKEKETTDPIFVNSICEGSAILLNDFDANDSMEGVGDLGLGEQAILIKQLVISYNEEALPKYTMTLDDEWEQTATSLDEIVATKVKKANVSYSNSIAQLQKSKLSKLEDDTATGYVNFARGLQTNEFTSNGISYFLDYAQSKGYLDSMTYGKGWGVDVNGNMQVESLEVRSALRVLELVYNRLSAEESEYVFTESGTIESVVPCEFLKDSDGNDLYDSEGNRLVALKSSDDEIEMDDLFVCELKKRSDTDFNAFRKNDILRAIVNNLTNYGSGEYYTIWMKVEDIDISMVEDGDATTHNNTIVVSLYNDEDTPSGTNYAIYPLSAPVVVQRWGNAVEPSEDAHNNEDYKSFIEQNSAGTWINRRQSCWYISSIEKRICMLDGVDKPKLTNSNYAAFFGLPVNFEKNSDGDMTFMDYTLNPLQPYLYCRGAFLQDVHYIDYKGRVMKIENFRGNWSAEKASSDPYMNTDTYYDTVYHNNAKWQCASSNTTDEPSSGNASWVLLEEALDGGSVVVASLTKNIDSVSCDSKGVASSDQTIQTTFEMYFGDDKQTLTSLEATSSNANVSITKDKSTGLVSVSILNGTDIGTVSITITITGKCVVDNSEQQRICNFVISPQLKGEQGDPGATGSRGAVLRGPSEWTAGTYYQSGEDGEEYIDIVSHPSYPNELFLCKVSHEAIATGETGANEPSDSTIAQKSWTIRQPWTNSDVKEFVATKFLLSDTIKTQILTAVNAQIDQLTVRTLTTSGSGLHTDIYGGTFKIVGTNGNAGIRIEMDETGTPRLVFYDSSGNKLYDLGPRGISEIKSCESSFSAVTNMSIQLTGTYLTKDGLDDLIDITKGTFYLFSEGYTYSNNTKIYYISKSSTPSDYNNKIYTNNVISDDAPTSADVKIEGYFAVTTDSGAVVDSHNLYLTVLHHYTAGEEDGSISIFWTKKNTSTVYTVPKDSRGYVAATYDSDGNEISTTTSLLKLDSSKVS